MNKMLFLATAALMAFTAAVAQTPDANEQAKLLALVKDVQVQQAQLAENQAKIDEKLSAVVEIVKDARLYSKRAK